MRAADEFPDQPKQQEAGDGVAGDEMENGLEAPRGPIRNRLIPTRITSVQWKMRVGRSQISTSRSLEAIKSILSAAGALPMPVEADNYLAEARFAGGCFGSPGAAAGSGFAKRCCKWRISQQTALPGSRPRRSTR